MSIWTVSIVLLATLYLLISEKIPIDLTSIGLMVALMLTGLLTPSEAVAGFANPAVITVGAMLLISRGLIRTGAVGFVTELVLYYSQSNKKYAFALILLAVAVASAFINNTPVVVLFIPIVMGLSCKCDFSPSTVLIPLSYVSILSGTCTLIGTSTNIIVNDLAAGYGIDQLSMFELGKLGLPIAVIGIIFLLLASPGLMPERTAPVCELDEGKEKRYIAELVVTQKSSLIGQKDILTWVEQELGLMVIELFRREHILDPSRASVRIQKGDILLVKGSAEDLIAVLTSHTMALAHGEEGVTFGPGLKDDLIIELLVPPLSSVLRESLLTTDLKNDNAINIIAIRSRRSHFTYRKVQRVKLKVGDMILVRCPRSSLDRIRRGSDFIIIEDIHHAIIDRGKAKIALGIFISMVIAASTGLADIMVCSLTGLFLMSLTRCLSLTDAYRSLESEVLLLIIATIALGLAMEKTGANELYAQFFLGLFQGHGPGFVLAGVILLSSVCTHILSNNATAVLLLPIAVSTAHSLGVDPKPFIVGICFGASACYASPIGYQTNLLVFGPGGYRFTDYLKLGLPLNLLVVVLSSILIPVIWPFY
jgi:di/tricarboxylate transporter